MTNDNPRFFYLANIRLPTEKAHGIQIMNTCSALAEIGVDIELVVPTRRNHIAEDPFVFYGLPRNFRITVLRCPDLVSFGKFGGILQTAFFSFRSALYILWHGASKDVIYSRHEALLFFPSFFRKRIFWETHMGSFTRMVSFLLPRIAGVVSITKGGKDFYVNRGVPSEKILVAPDGADIAKFSVTESKIECRKKLNLPCDTKIVLYTGSIGLYEWKGVDVLLSAAKLSRDKEILFLFVGGSEAEKEKMKKEYPFPNVSFIAQRPHEEIPWYLKAADVLVLPNKKGAAISEKFTSPMKLFEYMASGTPIAASDLPSIREVLIEETAVFFEPNDPEALKNAIHSVLDNYTAAEERAKSVAAYVRKFSWSARAGAIQKHVFSQII
jgi:glycosyltransferase involved in cell wall biosynthesis